MGLQLFDELNRTTAAYCRALGLDSTAYETPLSPAEVQIAEHMQRHGISRKAASMLIACSNMPARTVAMGPRKPAFHAVVEYASPVSMWSKQDITPFYEDQRAKYPQRAGVWVGD